MLTPGRRSARWRLRPWRALVLGLAAFLWIGSARASAEDPVVARIGPRKVTLSEFERLLSGQERDPTLTREEQAHRLLEAIVDKELLVLEARAHGLFADPEVTAALRTYEEDLLRRRYLTRHATADTVVTGEALAEAERRTRRRIRLGHIAHWSRAVIESIAGRLERGEDFAALAAETSMAARSAARGGDLGWLDALDLIPQFRVRVDTLAPGRISAPFETPFGFHLVKLDSVETAPPLDDSERSALRKRLRAARQRDVHLELFETLRERFALRIDAAAVERLVSEAAERLLGSAPADSTPQPPSARWQLEDGERALAVFEGGRVTASAYRERLLGHGFFLHAHLNLGAALRDVREIFQRQALVLAARAEGWDRDPEIRGQIEREHEKTAVTALYERRILGGIVIPEDEIRDFFTQNPARFREEEQVRYAFLEVRDPSVAAVVALELERGWGVFDSLTTALEEAGHLVAARRDTGGRPAGALPVELVEAARAMEPGGVGLLAENEGQVVFKLIQHQGERSLTYEEGKARAEALLRARRSEERLQRLLESSRGRYPVELVPEALERIATPPPDTPPAGGFPDRP